MSRWRSPKTLPTNGDAPIIAWDGERVGEAVRYWEEWRWANDSCSCCWAKC